MPTYSQMVQFRVDPRQQHELIAALTQVDEQFTCTCPGFIDASVQVSEDGLHVWHQVLWQSRRHSEAALMNIEPGVPDIYALMRRFRVRAAIFAGEEGGAVLTTIDPKSTGSTPGHPARSARHGAC